MEFVVLLTFDNYVTAHIAMGKLKDEGVDCWLKDEHLLSIDPILTNAVGGIKLMVDKQKAHLAARLLRDLSQEYRASIPCPKCDSTNVELVSTPRKARNWVGALAGFFLGNYAMPVKKVFHCFNCGHEYEREKERG